MIGGVSLFGMLTALHSRSHYPDAKMNRKSLKKMILSILKRPCYSDDSMSEMQTDELCGFFLYSSSYEAVWVQASSMLLTLVK